MRPTQLLLILSAILHFSCIEEIEPFVKSDKILVIYGGITNEYSKHPIRVYYTTNFNSQSVFVEDATVRVQSESGAVIAYEYNKYGYYYACDSVEGQPGESYELIVELGDGKRYLSTIDQLNAPPAIKSIQHELGFSEDFLSVLNFNIAYDDPPNQLNYYKWGFDGTYQVEAPEPGDSTYRFCWVPYNDNELISMDEDLFYDGRTIDNKYVFSIPLDRKFEHGFDLYLKQYSISKKAFEYWEALDNQKKNTGSIFEKSNFQIRGNIQNIDNPEELVLGLFEVAGMTAEHYFIDEYKHRWGQVSCDDKPCRPNKPCRCVDCHYFSGQATNRVPDFWPVNPYRGMKLLRKSFCGDCQFVLDAL